MDREIRAGLEFRVSGRTLSGTILRYGDIAPGHRERFMPGSLAPIPDVPLNIQHDRALVVLAPGDFVLTDTDRELQIRAELPASSAAIQLVRRGALRGFSLEFNAREERAENGIRVIERGELVGVSLVDSPAYPASKAEVRCALAPNGLPVVWL